MRSKLYDFIDQTQHIADAEMFSYIKETYKVPAEMYREVLVDGNKGVITADLGNYIGVNFYDRETHEPSPCHPTWRVEYLESFNEKPPILKLTKSKLRYRKFLSEDSGLTFREWL